MPLRRVSTSSVLMRWRRFGCCTKWSRAFTAHSGSLNWAWIVSSAEVAVICQWFLSIWVVLCRDVESLIHLEPAQRRFPGSFSCQPMPPNPLEEVKSQRGCMSRIFQVLQPDTLAPLWSSSDIVVAYPTDDILFCAKLSVAWSVQTSPLCSREPCAPIPQAQWNRLSPWSVGRGG